MNDDQKNDDQKDAGEIGYCVKCKEKRTMVEAEEVKMKNGRPAMKGKCEECGCGMYKILPSKKD